MNDWSDWVNDNPDRVEVADDASDDASRRSPMMQGVAKGSTERGRMNATEGRWARILDACDEVEQWWYEEVRFRYGDSGYATPDFMVLRANGFIEIHEVKAFCTDAGRTRFKASADRMWPFRWLMFVQAGKTQPWRCKYDTSSEDGAPYITSPG